MASLNSSYVEVNKDEENDGVDTAAIDDEEDDNNGGVEVSSPPQKNRHRTFGIATIICSFVLGFLLGVVCILLIGGSSSLLGSSSQIVDHEPSSLPENEDVDVKNNPEGNMIQHNTNEWTEEKEEQQLVNVPLPMKIVDTFTVLEQVVHDQTSFT